jgi:general secretion pathway protein A
MDYSQVARVMRQEKQGTSNFTVESGYRQPPTDMSIRTNSMLRAEQDGSILPKLLNFFGLAQQPFGVTPDPSFLYLGRTHREALSSLIYGIETGLGFLALIAQPGMGKTTLLFHLLEKFRNSAHSAFIFQTQCNSREFLQFLFSDFGFDDCSGQDFVRTIENFNQHLVREARTGKRFIVLIDEAQNLDACVLETVRLLSNFETPSAKLLQIILTGQPQLSNKLARPDMTQLQQRISSLNRLEPFSAFETDQYIQHRLRVSGYNGSSLLTPDALPIVAEFCKGIPRNINNFCFNALSLAFALQQKRIDAVIAREVISDLNNSFRPLDSEKTDTVGEPPHWSDFNGLAIDEVLKPSHQPLPALIQEPISAGVPICSSQPKHTVKEESTTPLDEPHSSGSTHSTEHNRISPLDVPVPASKTDHASEKHLADRKGAESPTGGGLASMEAPRNDSQGITIAEAKEYMDNFIRGLRNARS